MDGAAPFVHLNKINTVTATSTETFIDNIKANIARNLPRIQSLPEFRKPKGDKKIALVGGGPSLKNHLEELREFKTIIACGSSNDFLMSNNIIPTYTTVCDPDAISALYLSKTDTETKYLVASGCDEAVFTALKDKQIILWHCHSDEQAEQVKKFEPNYEAISGGCTVGLRSLSIAILFGYKNIHLFGFDSCLGENSEHHAYGFSSEIENDHIGQIYDIKLGLETPGEKIYRCIGYQLAQADHFRMYYEAFHWYFDPTFHGTGLLPDLIALIRKQAKELETQKVA